MYPPEVWAKNPSDAEKRLFRRIRQDLPDEWIALHSLGLVGHRAKAWAEIDFVLIGPAGIFCLEVKGGRVGRIEGSWIFTNRRGEVTSKREGPFEQVGTASATLRRDLHESVPVCRESVVGYGVVTPDISFDIKGPDIEPAVVYDLHDATKPFGDYLERLAVYWHERMAKQRDREVRGLNQVQRQAVLDRLRGDFDFRPSLRQRIGLVSDELLKLTHEQYRTLDGLVDNERALIRGGAGTGKTLLAVEEARRQAAAGRKVFLCCYNRQLAQFMAAALEDSPEVSVSHLHGFMATTIKQAGLEHRLPDAQEADLFSIFYPELCVEAVLESDMFERFDVLIVDEAQDLLLNPYLDVMEALTAGGLVAGTWRFFLDPKQNIYQRVEPEGMRRLLATQPAQFRLPVNCRNTVPISMVTSLISGVSSDEECRVEGPDVDQFWYRDEAEERRLISNYVNRLLSGGVSPQGIVILSRRRIDLGCLAGGISSVPYPLDSEESSLWQPTPRVLRASTISSFKGLEADAVLIIDIDDLTDTHALSGLYVGASRARAVLGLFLSEGVREQYERRALEYGREIAESHAERVG
jgi:hypothetical protein